MSDETLLETVRRIGEELAAPNADDVDRNARFPREAVDALKGEKALSAFVPEELGGGGVSPGFCFAAARTKARVRSKASVAIPSQRCDQRMCEIGTIDSGITRENGVGRICSDGNSARTT